MIQNFSRYQCFPSVGKIYDKKLKKFIEGYNHDCGYIQVSLQNDKGEWKTMKFHRVILESYRGEGIPIGYDVNHIDENKMNNSIKNLNLLTRKENINFGTRNERASKAIAKANKNNQMKSKQVGAFNKQGDLVYIFPSTREAQRQGFNSGAVVACCKNKYNREGNNIYKGYIWKYI